MELEELADIHKGETIWVLGSGPSLNYIRPEFFDDKTCVTVNWVGGTYGLKSYYAYSNYHCPLEDFGPGLKTAVLLHLDTLRRTEYPHPLSEKIALSKADSYYPPGTAWNIFENPPPPGQICYGSSSIHGAIHVAAHLGAATIILVGADCGWIDENQNVANYPWPTQAESFRVWNTHIIMLKQWLKEKYDVDVYSLNPFVNLNLEGHSFRGV